jgi:hypothetical protein
MDVDKVKEENGALGEKQREAKEKAQMTKNEVYNTHIYSYFHKVKRI